MAFKYKIMHDKETVFVQADGFANLETSIQAMAEVVEDKEFNPDYKIIVDLRRMEYNPPMIEAFTLRDSIVSFKEHINNDVTIVTTKEKLTIMNLIAFLSKVYQVKVKAVHELEGLDELEADLVLHNPKEIL